jgi:membrane-associated phospholipid phosphatase
MRTVEWVILIYCGYLGLLAIARRLPAPRRARIWALSGALAAAIVAVASAPSGAATRALRDWLPAVCILIGYWASGGFFTAPMRNWERWLADVDRRLRLSAPASVTLRAILELAYLSVYLVIPAGFAVAYFGHAAISVDRYWTTVVVAEFGCYGMLPWIQTRPPRSLALPGPPVSVLQRVNLIVLERGSIQVNTFPSAHTAGAVGTALALMAPQPVAGIVFLLWAALIAIGSVAGRYHYAVDAILGALWALLVWMAVDR